MQINSDVFKILVNKTRRITFSTIKDIITNSEKKNYKYDANIHMYIIQCSKCNKIFIGEIQQSLRNVSMNTKDL